jgi:hypothetical protein
MGIIVLKEGKAFEFLNSILVLTNCQVVVAIFVGLTAVIELIELFATEARTVEKAAMMGGCWNCCIVTGFG